LDEKKKIGDGIGRDEEETCFGRKRRWDVGAGLDVVGRCHKVFPN
jgi:hypothetical protein